jgi:cytoskeleton protein RodZ
MKEEAMEAVAAVEPEPKIGPGRDLYAAREARHLTQEAVAKQLHIDIALVRALEEDDYDRFAAPIFVTGHLRAYARLLGLAPEPLIEAYQGLGVAAVPALERVAHLSHQPEPVSRAQVPRWLVYVLAVAVVAVVVLVWRSEVSKIVLPIRESPLLSQGVPAAGGAVTTPLPVPDKPNEAAPQPAAAAQTPAALSATLDLKASKPSWVEVKDSEGNRLFYDLMVPGDVQHLEGVPPFDVLLGYAPGVTVEYNGKAVDHGPYARQGMARFRVGDGGTSKN